MPNLPISTHKVGKSSLSAKEKLNEVKNEARRVKDAIISMAYNMVPSGMEVVRQSMAAVAVIDSNVTTLIGAIVMWIFGGTSIVGFAVTLFISILVSMFTALLITRLNISLLGAFDNMNNPKLYMLKRSDKEAA